MFTTLLVKLSDFVSWRTLTLARERVIFRFISRKIKRSWSKPQQYLHTSKLGRINGTIAGLPNEEYYCFEGIPYAKPPVGKLRFKAPEPAEPWVGVLDATKATKQSLQVVPSFSAVTGDEDCLILNVYTKELPSETNKLRPVLVVIHGGAFIHLSADPDLFGPQTLLNEDVVLVCINYRLGVLGSLSLQNPELGVPGNAGFKDMVLALKWVQQNISDYNGDPNNVTIMGGSAGGVSTHLLVVSPLSKGLFHKAIVSSGTVLNCWGKASTNVARDLAEATGCQSTDEESILEHLQSLSPNEIMTGQKKLHEKDTFASIERYAGWVIEPPGEDAFLPRHPIDILTSGEYNQVPLIFGFTSNEGLLFDLFLETWKKIIYADDPELHVPWLLGLKRGSTESKELGKTIIKHYFGDSPPSIWRHKKELRRLLGDTCFVWGICAATRSHAKTSSQPVYLYQFSLDAGLNAFKQMIGTDEPGACHGEDYGYIFHSVFGGEPYPNSVEEITRKRFGRLFANFAKHGNPTPQEQDDLIPIKWKPVTKDELVYLDIEKKLTIETNPFKDTMEFWDKIYQSNNITKKLYY